MRNGLLLNTDIGFGCGKRLRNRQRVHAAIETCAFHLRDIILMANIRFGSGTDLDNGQRIRKSGGSAMNPVGPPPGDGREIRSGVRANRPPGVHGFL